MSAHPRLLVLGSLAAALTGTSLQAQVSVEWQRYHDDTSNTTDERALAIAVDPAGNVYSAGAVRDPSGPAGIFDPLLVKYDAAGQLLWSRRDTSVPGNERACALAPDGSGGIVVVASSFFGDAGNLRLLRYDAAGTLSWSSVPYDFSGGDDVVEAHECLIDAQGNVFVAATSQGASFDGVLLSYDSAGALRWATRIDGPGSLGDGLTALCFDGQGGVIVGGWTSDEEAHLVARVDGSGNLLWTSTFQASPGSLHKITAVACDAQGRVYALGIGPPSGGSGFGNGWLHRLDPASGSIQWSVSRAQTSWADLKPLGSGVVACGRRYLFGVDTSWNMLTERFASDGSSLWQRAWNDSSDGYDLAQRVIVEPGGDVLVAGEWYVSIGYPYWPKRLMCLRYAPDGTLRFFQDVVEPEAATVAFGGAALAADGAILLTGTKVKVLEDPIQPPDIETAKLRPQAVTFCAGDAAAGACPCGNDSPALSQRGCLNSIGQAARLSDSGGASLGADTLSLTSSGELPSSLSIFLQGDAFLAPLPFGDGIRCVGGNLKRLYARNAVQGSVSAPGSGDPSISARSSALGDPLAPGAQRGYQVYYRDPDPGFCPAPSGSTFNSSNALRIAWGG